MIWNLLVAAVFAAMPPSHAEEPAAPNPRASINDTGGVPNGGMPPVRYQGRFSALITFGTREEIDAFCGGRGQIIACHYKVAGVSVIMMPLPCAFADTEFFARVTCHEGGHSLGWTGFHEE